MVMQLLVQRAYARDAERSVPKEYFVNFSFTFRNSLTLLIVFSSVSLAPRTASDYWWRTGFGWGW